MLVHSAADQVVARRVSRSGRIATDRKAVQTRGPGRVVLGSKPQLATTEKLVRWVLRVTSKSSKSSKSSYVSGYDGYRAYAGVELCVGERRELLPRRERRDRAAGGMWAAVLSDQGLPRGGGYRARHPGGHCVDPRAWRPQPLG